MEILAKAVRMAFGSKEILKDMDFTLRDKEFVGIIGPNGSGKSTFLKCVYRVQKPTGGEILFDGKRLDELSYRESALKLAVVAQGGAGAVEDSYIVGQETLRVEGGLLKEVGGGGVYKVYAAVFVGPEFFIEGS